MSLVQALPLALASVPVIAAAQPPAAPPSEEEILVLGRKMQLIHVDIKAPKRDGRLVLERCRVTRPSGHAALDAVPCEVAQSCMASAPASRKALAQCVEQGSQGRLDAIVAQWRAARASQP